MKSPTEGSYSNQGSPKKRIREEADTNQSDDSYLYHFNKRVLNDGFQLMNINSKVSSIPIDSANITAERKTSLDSDYSENFNEHEIVQEQEVDSTMSCNSDDEEKECQDTAFRNRNVVENGALIPVPCGERNKYVRKYDFKDIDDIIRKSQRIDIKNQQDSYRKVFIMPNSIGPSPLSMDYYLAKSTLESASLKKLVDNNKLLHILDNNSKLIVYNDSPLTVQDDDHKDNEKSKWISQCQTQSNFQYYANDKTHEDWDIEEVGNN